MATIAMCYFPGLSGGFVFDDEVNILQNSTLQLSSLSARQVSAAAMSGDAGPLGRPIALISFALNLYATGADPFFFKLTNLLIHLCNVVLVGLLGQTLASRFNRGYDGDHPSGACVWCGLLIAAFWGLHPLNLTSVLYVVQRMTSLSALFGLLALVYFVRWRAAQTDAASKRTQWRELLHVSLIFVLLTASVLSKESGLLFLPLLLWIEYTVFGFRLRGEVVRLGPWSLRTLTSTLLALGTLAIVLFALPPMLGPGAFANRDFTLTERALTESRVLFYYLRLLVLPRSSELSLYHDDFQISTGLFEPATTALSLAALAAISFVTIAWRKRFPILLFAWGWFLISHALESTVFPLELVHEHRNYFATIGFFVALVWALQRAKDRRRSVAYVLAGGYLVLLAGVTLTRSLQWSNNVDLALLEASNHPRSARANYELGRNFLALLKTTHEQRFGPLAEQALRDAADAYLPGLAPYFGLVHQAYFRGADPDPAVVTTLRDKLQNGPFYNANTSFLESFLLCQLDRHCQMPDAESVQIFDAALANPRIPRYKKAEVYKLLAQYYISKMNDFGKGLEFIEAAASTYDSAGTRIMYAQALGLQGNYAEALKQLDQADVLDRLSTYRGRIERERAALRKPETP
ncbi:MAG: hypothetical protein EOO27_06395 [Comamonadaceae bacterium]|nr:MAG: hypothetical protein EOO27_06395 [Comamonadaceae bacterium]